MKDTLKRALPWAAIVSVTFAALARADYQNAYRKGLDAVQRHAWADAQREMRAAIAEQPTEGEQVKLYGMRFETYLPHYYLGLALLNAGDCAQALKVWSDSEGQGAVKGRPEYKDLRRDRATCETRLAATRPPATLAPPPPSSSAAEAAPVAHGRAAATPLLPSLAGVSARPAIPAELVDGAGAFFRAQYLEAVETLSRAHSGDERVNAHVLLLRSAARFALYSLSEGKDDTLKQAALADARACRRLDLRTTPSPKVFSPRFVSFFSGQP